MPVPTQVEEEYDVPSTVTVPVSVDVAHTVMVPETYVDSVAERHPREIHTAKTKWVPHTKLVKTEIEVDVECEDVVAVRVPKTVNINTTVFDTVTETVDVEIEVP